MTYKLDITQSVSEAAGCAELCVARSGFPGVDNFEDEALQGNLETSLSVCVVCLRE